MKQKHPLTRERKRRGWTQERLALEIGVSSITISRWERGITLPYPCHCEKLCQIFGKNVDELGIFQEEVEAPLQETSNNAALKVHLVPTASQYSVLSLCSVWNVPYRRNPLFTGREDILVRLHEMLHVANKVMLTQAISGLGGIGKTQTAVEYAYRFRDDYQAVLWAQADTRAILTSAFVDLAETLNIHERDEQDQRRAIEVVRGWLSGHRGWLLIFDNVEDLSLIEDFTPSEGTGHILLTTRSQSMGTFVQGINLEKMEPDEGILFLLRRAKCIASDALLEDISETLRADARSIYQVMDGLPLALDQAGAYIEETQCSLSDYLDLYHQRHAALLDLRGGGKHPDHPQSVATTLSLSFEQLETTYPAAADLLRFCAFLHPDSIPEEVIAEGTPDLLSPLLQPMAADRLCLDIAIAALRRYSLLHRNTHTKTLTVHRLVQAMLKDKMDEDAQCQWAERAVRVINHIFPDVEFATWQRCQRYLPQAQHCAGLVEQREMKSPQAARLLYQAGVYLHEHGRDREAELLLQHAFTIREQVLGPNHPEVAQCLNQLVMLYRAQGKYKQAEPLAERAISLSKEVLGPRHPEVAKSLNQLALLYWNIGKYKDGEPLVQRAIFINESELGPHHPEVAKSLNQLALLSWDTEKYKDGEPPLERAIAIGEQSLGHNHPDMVSYLNNLAMFAGAQSNYEKAEPLLREAIDLGVQTLGPDHPDVAIAYLNMYWLSRLQGKKEQAATCIQRAVFTGKQLLGSGSRPYLIPCFSLLGKLLKAQNDYVEAEALLRTGLSIFECILDPGHPHIAIFLNLLARVFRLQGRYEESEPLLRRARDIVERSLDPSHPLVAEILHNLTSRSSPS